MRAIPFRETSDLTMNGRNSEHTHLGDKVMRLLQPTIDKCTQHGLKLDLKLDDSGQVSSVILNFSCIADF